MIFQDYYQWLLETLRHLNSSSQNSVNWYVKPHPSLDVYREGETFRELFLELSNPRVQVWPKDLNSESVMNVADVVVTVHGTGGLEAACRGIPVVLAGRPFYSGWGFTHDPQNRDHYFELLSQASELSGLTNAQTELARKVLGNWHSRFFWTDEIIDSDVLSEVWGANGSRNPERAIKIVVERLRLTKPQDSNIWRSVQDLLDGELAHR